MGRVDFPGHQGRSSEEKKRFTSVPGQQGGIISQGIQTQRSAGLQGRGHGPYLTVATALPCAKPVFTMDFSSTAWIPLGMSNVGTANTTNKACPVPHLLPISGTGMSPQQYLPARISPFKSHQEKNKRMHPGEVTSPGRRLFLSSGRLKDTFGITSVDVIQEHVAPFF